MIILLHKPKQKTPLNVWTPLQQNKFFQMQLHNTVSFAVSKARHLPISATCHLSPVPFCWFLKFFCSTFLQRIIINTPMHQNKNLPAQRNGLFWNVTRRCTIQYVIYPCNFKFAYLEPITVTWNQYTHKVWSLRGWIRVQGQKVILSLLICVCCIGFVIQQQNDSGSSNLVHTLYVQHISWYPF